MGAKKELLPIAGVPMIRSVVERLLESEKIDEVVVVLGHQADDVGQCLAGILDWRLELVGNTRYQQGMGTSLAQGASACSWATDAIVVTLGDTPFFRRQDVDRLIHAHTEGAKIAVPVFEGRRGHPIVIDGSYKDELEGLSGDAGARHILERAASSVVEVELEDDGFLMDIDERDDYEAVKDGITPGR
jgi:molybdenum cofactor cytidylyltransferase